MLVEIQDDETREHARLGGERMVVPTDTREQIVQFPRNEIDCTVTALVDEEGNPTWVYLAVWL